MTIAVATHTIAGGTSGGVTSSAIDSTACSLLVAGVASNILFGAEPVLTDSKSNTWVPLTLRNTSSFGRYRLFYVVNPVVGSGHTFTLTGADSYGSVAVLALTGVTLVTPFDVENGSFTTSTSVQPGSVTPSIDNEILVTGVCMGLSGGTLTIDSGYTISDQIDFSSGNYTGQGLAFLIQTTAGASNPTWSIGSAQALATCIASFKMASSTGYTLVAGQGSYGLTGQGMVPKVTMPVTQGSYALSGQSVGMLRNYVFNTITGLYELRGSQLGSGSSRYPLSRRRGR